MKHGDVIRCWRVVEASSMPSMYFSVIATDEYRLSYRNGEVTEKVPGTLGIFSFKTIKAARTFMEFGLHKNFGSHILYVIIEGEGVLVQSRGIKIYPTWSLKWWYASGLPPLPSSISPVPRGTILVDRFRTIGRV